MSRSPHWSNGWRAGQKDIMRRLYEFADEMNDPHARLVLHLAADTIGKEAKRDWSKPNESR